MLKRNWAAVVAAATSIILWASAFVGIRQVGHQISPGALALARLAVGSTVLGLVSLRRTWVRPTRTEWIRLTVCGVSWFGVYNLVLNEAERHADAGLAAMVVNIGPILIAALAGVLLHEGYPSGLLAGSVLALGGVVIIAMSGGGGVHGDPLGIALCVAAAVAYAVGVVSQKPLLRRLPALTVTSLACVIGMVICAPFAPVLIRDLQQASGGTILLLLYLGIFPTAVAFSTWAFALSRTTAGRMGATTYLVPPIAILLAWILLAEPPAPLALVGGVLCLLGVYLTRRKARVAPRTT